LVSSSTLVISGRSLLVASLNVSSLDVLSLSGNVVVSFWVVDDLGLNWEILDSFPDSFDWFVFDDCLFDFFWNVFDLSFNGIVIGDGSFDWDSFSSGDFFVFNDFSFVGNSLDSFDLIVFDVFLFEWNVFNSGFDWDLFGNDFLDQILGISSDSRVSISCVGIGLVD